MPKTGEWGSEWDHVSDLVIVGCGAAGASAAVTATAAGASTVILEKAAFVGGTTARSGGMMWIPNNPVLREAGRVDERSACLRYMCRTAYPTLYQRDHPTCGVPQDRFDIIAAFYDNGSAALEHHMAVGALGLQPVDYPNYYAQLDEDECKVGRSVDPQMPEGWVYGRDQTGGMVLVEQLMDYARTHGARLLTRHEVIELAKNDAGEVIGVVAHAGGRTVLIGAKKGVVFASGGFLHNPRMVLDFLRGPIFGGAAAHEATGDFVRIGIANGAQLGNMANAWWAQEVLEMAARSRVTSSDVYSPFGDSMIQVNRFGKRAVNEKAPYNERGQVHHVWDQSRCEYPNRLMFMLFDQAVVESTDPARFRWPVPPAPGKHRDFLIQGDSWPELIVNIRANLARLAEATGNVQLDAGFETNLSATIGRWNNMAARGVDEDFLRGQSPIEQRWASPAREGAPSASMYPFRDHGPYYCIILCGGALDTKGGPVTNADAQVMSVDGRPIPGLYGAGNCVAAPAAQAYWGPGGTVGPALVFGYVAARHALGQPMRSPTAQ